MQKQLRCFCSFLLSVVLIFAEVVPGYAQDEPVTATDDSSVSANDNVPDSAVPRVVPTPVQAAPTPADQGTSSGDVSYAYADVSAALIHLGGSAGNIEEPSIDYAGDTAKASEEILKGLQAWSDSIDITSCKIPADDIAAVFSKTVNSHPELFYVTGAFEYSYTYGDETVTVINPEYSSSYSPQSVETFNEKVSGIMESVNTASSDLEKLIIIHDHIVMNCEYDQTQSKPGATDAYGCLVNGLAVCHGYSEAFMYLAGKVGVKGQVVSSVANDHAWNIVSLGGKWYYVDVTWDDPIGTDDFYCRYTNFLRSREGMKDTGHVSNDWTGAVDGKNVYNTYAGSNTYDSFFWSDMIRPIPLAGGMALYYSAGKLNIYDLNRNSVKTFTPQGGGCTAITAVSGVFYYSTVSSIYSLTTAGNMTACYNLSNTESSYGGIYELTALSYGVRYHIMKAAYTKVLYTGVYVIDGLPVPSGVTTPEPTKKTTVTPTKAPTATPTPTAAPTAADDTLYVTLPEGDTYTYTGSAIKPSIVVFYKGVQLLEEVDYKVSYNHNVNSGDKATLSVSGIVYPFTAQRSFNISRKSIADEDVTVLDIEVTAGGKLPQPQVFYGGKKLAKSDIIYDGSLRFSADGLLSISGSGNYCGTRDIKVSVGNTKKPGIKLSLNTQEHIYNGMPQKLGSNELKVYEAGTDKELGEGIDYVVIYPADVTNAGVKKIKVIGIGEYGGSIEKSYKILPCKNGKLSIGNPNTVYYTPMGSRPVINVTVDGTRLEPGKDYKLRYSSNRKIGVGKYTVNFIGNYKGRSKYTGSFNIKAASLETGAYIRIPDMAYLKEGKYYATPYVIKDDRQVAASQLDVRYFINGKERDKGTKISEADFGGKEELKIDVEVSGKKNYEGKICGSYMIKKTDKDHDISKAAVTIINKTTGKKVTVYTYTGSPITVGGDDEIRVTIGKEKTVLTAGKDYEIEYANNVNKGKAVILIKGTGGYAGTAKGGFKIVKGTL
ncbi:MAG: hypothetical protein IKR23_13595 [Lachnospiraceae bacterium]|nr:hypothetical protein [Lachnospiraceae bacterium]